MLDNCGIDFAKIERFCNIRERVLPVIGIIYWIVLPVLTDFYDNDNYIIYCAAPIVLFVSFLVFMSYRAMWKRNKRNG